MATTNFLSACELNFVTRWVGKRNIADALFSADTALCLVRLERLTMALEASYGCTLPRINLMTKKKVKEFCDGILDPCVRHPWRIAFREQHLSLRVRLTIASSVFLFRKVCSVALTKSETATRVSDYIDKMTTPRPKPSNEFLSFASDLIDDEFRLGWDGEWSRQCDSFTPPTSSCLERSRQKGGARGGNLSDTIDLYERFVSGDDIAIPSTTRVCGVLTGGKTRLVSVYSENRSFLTPVHRTIYNALSKKKWLLRGEATQDVFKSFVQRKGEVFVSGDYESATDNLNLDVSRHVLKELLRKATHIPNRVKQSCMDALVSDILLPDGTTVAQEVGQMMGSLLSFPLLCLINYISFKFAVRRNVPVKINGDDIVFRARADEVEKWKKCVNESGLTLSVGKTAVRQNWFSLNSTFFHSSRVVTRVDTVRSQALFGRPADPSEFAGRMASLKKDLSGDLLVHCQTILVSEARVCIDRSQRSLRRGLGIRVSNDVLRRSRLLEREHFYCALDSEPIVPLPKKMFLTGMPSTHERVPGTVDCRYFCNALIQHAWSGDFIRGSKKEKDDAYWARVREGTYRFIPVDVHKFARLIKRSAGYVREQVSLFVAVPPPVALCWKMKAVEDANPCVAFVYAGVQ